MKKPPLCYYKYSCLWLESAVLCTTVEYSFVVIVCQFAKSLSFCKDTPPLVILLLSLPLPPDNVTLHLDGVLYYRVIDPYKVSVKNQLALLQQWMYCIFGIASLLFAGDAVGLVLKKGVIWSLRLMDVTVLSPAYIYT